ncbi:MAG: tryptophan synthase subunit alpha, partial [Candidatus Thorarchaeota archaeon]|nr:tryptophan synthase subunit alpha [Candidatus Thorarchaeota archaeon]
PYVAGVGNFLNRIREAGAQAIIVPNVPVEEADVLLTEGKKSGVHIIFQIAPTTTEDRLKKITDIASGFLYVINVEGVTGVRESLADSTLKLVVKAVHLTSLLDLFVVSSSSLSNRPRIHEFQDFLYLCIRASIHERQISYVLFKTAFEFPSQYLCRYHVNTRIKDIDWVA